METEIAEQIKNIRFGHILLAACCAVYLVWWSITFNPMRKFPGAPKAILFVCMLISGLGGLYLLVKSSVLLSITNKSISNIIVLICGVFVYALLLYITNHFLHRQVTTELLLIVLWTTLEVCIVFGTCGASVISIRKAVIMAAVVILGAVISMVCYLLYYDLRPVPAFYDGMVPLILIGIIMAVQAAVIR